MKNKKIILHIILISTIVIIAKFLFTEYRDTDYKKLGLKIEYYDIDYYIVYDESIFGEYKVYKINDINRIKNQLDNSDIWSRNQFYEYIINRFYEKIGRETVEIDRENLYYYHKKGIYAIIDIKNSKLYYSSDNPFYHQDYSEILEIKTNNYENREIYSVRGGPQNDGADYYVYKFNEEKGKEIEEILSRSQIWNKEKLDNDILDCFEYNSEISSIQNGYYHYKKVCRTRDKYKKEHFTDEEATGYEVGVYDCDKHILYYYWESI